MPWTSADIDTIKAAILAGKGARSITFSDQTITFHSIEDMMRLLSAMETDVAAAGDNPSRTRYAAFSKGA